MKTHKLKHRYMIGGEKKKCFGYSQPNIYIKQLNENSPAKAYT